VKGRRNGPYHGPIRTRRYYSNDPFVDWLYRDPRRAASLSVLFTVGSIVVWLTLVLVVIVYLALKVF
jgi:hypothetical protein